MKNDLFFNDVQKGDKVTLFIPPAAELNGYTIEMGQIVKNGVRYVDEAIRNKKRRHNSNGGLFAGTVLIAIAFIDWVRNKKRLIRKH